MSALSELSVLELDAERGELLPEREALLNIILGLNLDMPVAIQINVLGKDVHQMINQTATQAVTQAMATTG